ncbi:MAG: CDGSH iron-sulfur domain-containing protein [Alistipes sp.]|jgi:CDGSH-type Zn-finger protein|nr:CDGSH iron-sulfur domain-containing protein [Alistipes sp.]
MSTKIQKGSKQAAPKFRIDIADGGPLMVHGQPPLVQKFIVPNDKGEMWWLQDGLTFKMATDPVALCRCGESKNKPYCDGAHATAQWDSRLTAPETGVLEGAQEYEGPTLTLTDGERYCAFARFCDAGLRVWNEVGESDSPEHRDMTIREANHCIAGRLSAWDNASGEPHEPELEPELGLVEDPKIHASAGLFVSGGIPISRPDGFTYVVRNRASLCRCGQSSNKPWCDGTHASFHWQDGLGGAPTGKKW